MSNANEIAPSAMQLAGVALKAGEQVADLERLAAPHGIATEHEPARDDGDINADAIAPRIGTKLDAIAITSQQAGTRR